MKLNAINFKYNTNLVSEKAHNAHVQLYREYVDKSNEILSNLETSNPSTANHNYSLYRALKKELSYCLNGVTLHEMFFENIGQGNERPGQSFLKLINNFDKWKKDFIATAMAARGWAVCAYDQGTKQIINGLQDTYSEDYIVTAYPLLVIDLYEHGRVIDYQNDKKSYIDNFMQCIKWDIVEKRAKKLHGDE